jgi:hypothetical protein
MSLPFSPQPLPQLKARLPEALKEVHAAFKVIDGHEIPASRNPKNVFDTKDQIRLIISLDDICGETYLHVSASSPYMFAMPKKFHETARKTLNELGVLKGRLASPHDVTEGGIPHWFWNSKTHKPPTCLRSRVEAVAK